MSDTKKQKMLVVEVAGKKVGIPLWQFAKLGAGTKYDSTVYVTKILDIFADGKTGTVQCLDGNGEATGAIFEDVSMLGTITAIGGTSIVSMSETAWSLRATPANNKWQSICHGNDRFVAVSSDGTNRVMYSMDGKEWILCTDSVTNGAAWQSVCFYNGMFVAVASSGTNRVMTSPDGIHWTAVKAAAQNSWRSVCGGNGRFVAVSSDGTKRVMYSTDNGQTWSLPTAKPVANPWRSVCFGNGKFLAVASSGTNQVMVSSDGGVTWVGYKPSAARAYRSVCFGEGKFVAVSSGSKTHHCMVSEDDGITWTSYLMPNCDWQCVCYGDGLWVAVANSCGTSRIVVADDGHSWGRKLIPKNLNWQSVCYGNGIFAGVAANGKGSRAMSSDPTSFNINYGFVGQYALVVEFDGTKFAVLPGGSLTGDPVEDEELMEEEGILAEAADYGAWIETHDDDSDAHAALFAALRELLEEHLEPASPGEEYAHLPLFEAKQEKITATGTTNLLTAPETVGGQPGTKAISDFATAAQGALAETALQKESDPVYIADKPNIALKTEIAAVQTLVSNLEFVKDVSFNPNGGVITFTFRDNSTLAVDVINENLAQSIDYDAATKELVITRQDGSTFRVSIADLVDVYTGFNGTHIQVTIGSNNVITAVLKAGTVSETELTSALLAKINGKLDATAQAADSAKLGGKLPNEYEPAFTKNTAFNKKLGNVTVQTVASASPSTTASRTYPVQVNANDELVVNVPWSNTTYSAISQANIENTAGTTAGLITGQRFKQAFDANVIVAGLMTASDIPKATSTVFGSVKLGSDTVQTATAAAIGTTASRTYLVQKNSSDQLVVNVPWSDTNTTYSTITQAEIDAGTGTATRVVTPKLLVDNFSKATHTHTEYASASHTHGTYSRTSSVLSGANVFSNIVVANGIVTNTETRTLTASEVGAAPTNHASTATTYGAASKSNYGHLQLSDDSNVDEWKTRTNAALAFNALSGGTINLNNYRWSGEWAFSQPASASNFPSSGTWTGTYNGSYLKVTAHRGDQQGTQTLVGGSENALWFRTFSASGTFTAWVKIATTADIPAGANLSVTTASFGQAIAHGSATTFARSDHSHPLPAAPTTITGAAWTTAFTPTDNAATQPVATPPSATGANHFANLYAYAEWLNTNKGTSNLVIGTTASTACAGNDSRLSDARTPTAHNQAASTITAGIFGTSAGTYTFDGSSVVRLGSASSHRAYLGFGDGDYIRIGEYEADDKLSFKASTYQFYASSTAIASASTTGFAFTGTPTAPTATAGTNTTQIATTAFVAMSLDGKQNQLTATGTTNLLTAPSAAGGQPGTKAINTLLASPEAQTANRRLLLAPATKGNAPDMVAAPTVVGTVPTFDGSSIVWQRPGGSTTLTAHLVINGCPVWIFLDDANVAQYGDWIAYEAGTYLFIAIGSGGNGGNGTSSGTNVYCGGEGGSGGLAVSRYSVTTSQLNSYKAADRRFLRWKAVADGTIYIYITDTGQSTGVRTMTATVGGNGATSTSSGVGNGGAGGLGSGGNVANFRGAGGMGGIRTNGSGNIGSIGNGGIDGTRQDGTGNYNDYMGKRFNVDPNGWSYPRFNGRYFHHQATGVFLPHNWLPGTIGGDYTVEMGGGAGGGGGASDGWIDRNRGYGGPGAVIIIKES